MAALLARSPATSSSRTLRLPDAVHRNEFWVAGSPRTRESWHRRDPVVADDSITTVNRPRRVRVTVGPQRPVPPASC